MSYPGLTNTGNYIVYEKLCAFIDKHQSSNFMLRIIKEESKKVFIQNVTEEYTQITIAGPKARLLLEKLGGLKLDNDNFKPLDFFEGKLGNFEARVFRISFSGELSFEIAKPEANIKLIGNFSTLDR